MKLKFTFLLFLSTVVNVVTAQDERSQLPPIMQRSYFEVNIGAINYPFSAAQLEPGYNLVGVTVPPMAVRLVLWGYDFNKYFAGQVFYMRPVSWVRYSYEKGVLRIVIPFGRM